MLEKYNNQKTYANIIDGSIRVRSTEGIEGAKKRNYELSDGTKGFKWELSYSSLSGMIEKIELRDSDYGRNIEITVDGITLQTGTKGNYGQDLMKKLPDLDLSQPIRLVPYSFEDDNKKLRRGITVYQNNKKILSYFHILEGTKIKAIYGFPAPENNGAEFKKNDWVIYFIKVEEFLADYTEKNVIPKLHKEISSTADVFENAKEIMEGEDGNFVSDKQSEADEALGIKPY